MDKNRSHVLSPESLEEVRNLELQDPHLRSATASKRMAVASEDATDCQLECAEDDLQEMGWSECRRRRVIHSKRTGSRTGKPSSHHTIAMERTSESCWVERADGL